MRIAKVIGKITLSRQLKEVKPGSFLLVRPCGRGALAAVGDGDAERTQNSERRTQNAERSAAASGGEELVMYDILGAREGDLTGLVEGREATAPFGKTRVPYDAYNGCILESVDFRPILPV